MGQLQGVNVEQLQGGLNRLAVNTDSHFAYFDNILEAISELNNNMRPIRSVYEAENLGINASFDDNHNTNIYIGIQDFFRLAPEGVLYLCSTDGDSNLIKRELKKNPEVKGVGMNYTDDTYLFQEIINELKSENRFIDFAIIGYNENISFVNNLFELECPNVSVCIAAEKPDGKVSLLSVLGMLAVRQVSENLGSVDILNKPLAKRGRLDYPLTDSVLNRWTKAYLTNGEAMDTLPQSTLNALKSKGYIMAASYEGYPGYFFENSYTSVERSSDFAFIENNRVWNKAARIVRATLIPRVKSKVKKDPQTGFIASTTTSYWESLISNALEQQMVNTNDISGFDVFIDNKQVVSDTEAVKIKLRIVMDDIAHEFEVAIGLTNNLA
jgi:hypothetical protein